MDAIRVKSKRTGRAGWRYRFTDPVSHARTHRTIWIGERREADKGIAEYLAAREKLGLGLPDNSGWTTSYADLVRQFIEGSVIASEHRRDRLEKVLKQNHLGIKVGADLANAGKLTAECRRLSENGAVSRHYAAFSIQRPLKQLSRWAASVGILPYDPLATWKQLPWGAHKKRRPLEPNEMQAILAAAAEYDEYFRHQQPSDVVFRTLLLTGNRPRAVLNATVADLTNDRLILPTGNGKKRNGVATLPPEFVKELQQYSDKRSRDSRLLLSHEGDEVNRINLGKYFRRCMTLAFTRMEWPSIETTVDPLEVAHVLYMGKHRGFDGAPPRKKEKIEARARHVQEVERVVQMIAPAVQQRLSQRDMYALRATHISWARRLTNPDSVKLQVGHAPRDTEERHYLGMVDASLSSKAVWDVLTGARTLAIVDPIVALDSKSSSVPRTKTGILSVQVMKRGKFIEKAGEGVRTLDFDLGKVALYH